MSRESTVKKICQHCNRELSLSRFYRNRTKTDGHNGICKECQAEVNENNRR